jgi:DNA polymerase-3 subunit gamma/tau
MTRMWQMLLKALDEVASAPNAMMAAEMAIIRLTHVAELPSPEELIRKLQNTPAPMAQPGAPNGGGGGTQMSSAQNGTQISAGAASVASAQTRMQSAGHSPAGAATALQLDANALERYATFEHIVDLIRSNRDVKLLVDVEGGVQLVSYQPGRIEFVPHPNAPQDLAQRLGQKLQLWTGNRWAITLVNEGGQDTIAARRDAAANALQAEAEAHPMVQAVLAAFPKARILQVKTLAEIAKEAMSDALPEVEDEWDPFEED